MTFSFSFRALTKLDAQTAVDTAAKPNVRNVPQSDKLLNLVRGLIDAQPADDEIHEINVIAYGHVDATGGDSKVTIEVTRPLLS